MELFKIYVTHLFETTYLSILLFIEHVLTVLWTIICTFIIIIYIKLLFIVYF